ncbi:MAG: CobD/CbiB family protein [Zoogloeaceae bacterium]|jgi:cobalamin biosynthesis protein CobD/CbiB|nr:CobD/CbiB family protein [Zoogloeaceae bacterium]
MSFFALIVVFLLEQLQPLNYPRWIARPVRAWTAFWARHMDAGKYSQGVLGAVLAVFVPLLLLGVAYGVLYRVSVALAFLLEVLALYLTLGFRQFSHFYTDIQLALRLDDVARARALLSEWRGENVTVNDAGGVARMAIETALASAHRHVFAVLLWFVLLPGPLGAVLYRLSHLLCENWHARGAFGRFSRQLFWALDWLPARVTAVIFAGMGNFVDAFYCWRRYATRWYDPGLGIVIASGAGALGVRLGLGVPESAVWPDDARRKERGSGDSGIGEAADVEFMQSAVGLVWRAIVLWLLLLLLLGFARLAAYPS